MSRYAWETAHPALEQLRTDIAPTRDRVLRHPSMGS